MCGEAKWKISTDLCNDQPLDASGYITADAVCRLREAALAEANGWHRTTLPDYAQQECIDRGNKVLRKKGLDRILEADEVNRLVRHYSYLDQRYQAAEEWWAGAVALDNFLTGLPDMVAELATTNLGQRHRWRAWIVNTQHSAQLGSHWFTVVVGATVGDVPQLLQSTASSSAAGREPPDSIGSVRSDQDSFPIESEANAARLNNYQNLFDSPGAAIDLITWARAHTTYPGVSAWLEACSQWDAAIVSKEHLVRNERRKLCQKHGIPLTNVINTNANVEAAMEQVRRKLLAQIQEIQSQHQPPHKKTKHRCGPLDNYFTRRVAGDACPEIEELHTPDVATDVSSTYLRLRAKSHIYAEDKEFRIVKDTLSELRGFVHETRLHKMTTDPRKTSKTIRQEFKERGFRNIAFNIHKSPDEATGAQKGKAARHFVKHSLTWRTYYVKLLVLAQARRWLSATERLDPISDAPPTPKTNFQLADAIKQSKKAEFAPFGSA